MPFYFDAEYLLWRISNAPIAVPLVSTNASPGTIGALNEPGTRILFGAGSGSSDGYGWLSGLRLTAGAWTDSGMFGWEASGFILPDADIHFNAASPGGTAPVVSLPFTATQPFNGNPAGPTSLNAGGAPNQVSAEISTRLWGADTNALFRLYRDSNLRITALLGFRYLDLAENLTLSDNFTDPSRAGGAINVSDGFSTHNQFYGGQVGLKAEGFFDRWIVTAAGKFAWGDDHQTLTIGGGTTVTNNGFGFPNSFTPGGIFAQPSNIGQYSRDVFAIVPEITFKVGYMVTNNLQAFVGYNFLLLTDAIRPGNQISSNINPTQDRFFVPPGSLSGPAAPLPFFQPSAFWAQGVNLGLELKF